MQPDQAKTAARLLWTTWQQGGRLTALPQDCRPTTRGEGYAVQAALAGGSYVREVIITPDSINTGATPLVVTERARQKKEA